MNDYRRIIALVMAMMAAMTMFTGTALAETEDQYFRDIEEQYLLESLETEPKRHASGFEVSGSVMERIRDIEELPDYFPLIAVYPRGAKESTVEEIHRLIGNGEYLIYESFPTLPYEELSDIWHASSDASSKTYGVYQYGLYHVSRMANVYKKTGDELTGEYMTQVVESFLDFAASAPNKYNSYLYNEFAVSTRTVALAEYMWAMDKQGQPISESIREKLLARFKTDLEKLLTTGFYNDFNHGLWQDMAVLTIARLLDDSTIEKALCELVSGRLDAQINTAFNGEGVNVENSTYYHYYNMKQFQRIENFVIDNGFDLKGVEQAIADTMALAEKVLMTMVRPDKTVPMIGDSSPFTFSGAKYDPATVIYEDTGLAFLKTEDSMITVKAGFTNTTHKHDDDLSFTWYYKGHDVFLDAGKYNYDVNDRYRQVIRSPLGHNILGVDGEYYPYTKWGGDYAGFTKVRQEDDYTLINMYLNVYDGVKLTRSFIWIEPNIIILVDRGKSGEVQTYLQNFLINPFESNSLTKTTSTVKGDGITVSLRQWWRPDYAGRYNGNAGSARGWYSVRTNQRYKALNVFFKRAGEEKRFLTSIVLDTDSRGEHTLKNLKLSGSTVTATLGSGKVMNISIK